jgi:hypothetical protein
MKTAAFEPSRPSIGRSKRAAILLSAGIAFLDLTAILFQALSNGRTDTSRHDAARGSEAGRGDRSCASDRSCAGAHADVASTGGNADALAGAATGLTLRHWGAPHGRAFLNSSSAFAERLLSARKASSMAGLLSTPGRPISSAHIVDR